MLKDIGCNEEVVISGFLHDLLEDTKYDYKYFNDEFGKNTADNVLAVFE